MLRFVLALFVVALVAIAASAKPSHHCKDAKSGHWVTPEYAAKHPKTTFCYGSK